MSACIFCDPDECTCGSGKAKSKPAARKPAPVQPAGLGLVSNSAASTRVVHTASPVVGLQSAGSDNSDPVFNVALRNLHAAHMLDTDTVVSYMGILNSQPTRAEKYAAWRMTKEYNSAQR